MFRALSRTAGHFLPVRSSQKPGTMAPLYVAMQSRSFFKFKTVENIRRDVEKAATERDRIEALKQYVALNPEEATLVLHSGINEGRFVGNNEYARQYLLGLARTKKLDDANMDVIMNTTLKAQGATASANTSTNNASVASGTSVLNVGNSPSAPIFVQSLNTRSSIAFRFAEILIKFIITMIVIAVAFELFSEINPGGSMSKLAKSAVHQAETSDKRFDDVIGIDEAKHDLQEIVMYLKDPKKFTRLGGTLPKGVLLTGPPGTGKTLLARAIAGEAEVPFYFASGSEFEEMYVGVGAKRIRELFSVAKANSPCIVFIDEIDAIGGRRNDKDQSTHRMTLNQLLVEMDGFEQNSGVILIAATNFPESLDPALVRPGRFDKRVDIPTPDIGGRKAILQHYVNKVIVGNDVDLEQLARGTPGFSGADLSNLVNQAAIHAAVQGLKSVGMAAFEYAKDKILMGAERRSAVISPETMKATAYHEAGHAIMALFTKGANPIHKATIMPRGRALGMVMQLPEGDQTSLLYKEMLARLDVCMGGRVAEEIFFGSENISSGASSDIEQATRMARAMVARFGLSSKVGPIHVDQDASEKTKNEVDDEVRRLLMESYARTKALIEEHRKDLETVANGLLEYESLSGSELVDLLKGIKPTGALRSQKPSREIESIDKMKKKESPVPQKNIAENSKSNVNTASNTANKTAEKKTITINVNNGANSSNTNSNSSAENNNSTVVKSKAADDETEKKEDSANAAANSGRLRGPPK